MLHLAENCRVFSALGGGKFLLHGLSLATMLPYCVYILFSEKDNLLYIGYSSNLPNRVEKHNTGGVLSTASRRPLKLIFCEYYLFEEDARKRETYFKTTMGKKAIKYMLGDTLKKLGYKGSLLEKDLPVIYDS
jgi:putative endonuclease